MPQEEEAQRTVAWYSGEGDIHVDSKLLATTLVNDDRSVNIHRPIVDEFNGHESQDNSSSNKRYYSDPSISNIAMR